MLTKMITQMLGWWNRQSVQVLLDQNLASSMQRRGESRSSTLNSAVMIFMICPQCGMRGGRCLLHSGRNSAPISAGLQNPTNLILDLWEVRCTYSCLQSTENYLKYLHLHVLLGLRLINLLLVLDKFCELNLNCINWNTVNNGIMGHLRLSPEQMDHFTCAPEVCCTNCIEHSSCIKYCVFTYVYLSHLD